MAILVAAGVAMTGCVSRSRPEPVVTTITHSRTQFVTTTPTPRPPTPTYRPAPVTTVAPLPPGATPARGEVERRCPYIASSPEQNPATNVAAIDGSHVYRTTVLTRHSPVGCRFYFYTAPYYAIVDIVPTRFATHREAYAAMIATARQGSDVSGEPALLAGIDAIIYRTKFYGADGSRDWACVFTTGRTMVIVHTQRTDTSLNAVLVARAVARRF